MDGEAAYQVLADHGWTAAQILDLTPVEAFMVAAALCGDT